MSRDHRKTSITSPHPVCDHKDGTRGLIYLRVLPVLGGLERADMPCELLVDLRPQSLCDPDCPQAAMLFQVCLFGWRCKVWLQRKHDQQDLQGRSNFQSLVPLLREDHWLQVASDENVKKSFRDLLQTPSSGANIAGQVQDTSTMSW